VRAPERFVAWMADYEFKDRKGLLQPGLKLQYHSRSDEHSKVLGELIVQDLLDVCDVLREQAERGDVGYGINYKYRWANGKEKTLDVAIGTPPSPLPPPGSARIHRLTPRKPAFAIARLLVAIEEKAVMTEHGKAQPRIYSELNDSHTIVHQGGRDTVSGGITVVNIAATFVSPLRQRPDRPVEVTIHRQPDVTDSMVKHLRRLPAREALDDVGLDAYCTFVVNVDNQGRAELHDGPPAPQPGAPDHYETFLDRICRFYTERFGDLARLRPEEGVSLEDALAELARQYPGLLEQVGELAAAGNRPGGNELQALLQSVALRARGAIAD
jgi:hypothetical protein